jgi:glycosyltransferase involved in cell wall biosynthesis
MRILLVHNRYQFFGGEDVIVQQEKNLLEAGGCEICLYEQTNADIKTVLNMFLTGLKAVYSFSAKKEISSVIKQFQPDVMHIHNFFPLLSPSIYQAAKEKRVAVVQSLHNYRLVCPNALLFKEGKICEQCVGLTWPWFSLFYGCYRKQRMQTLPVFCMLGWHNLRHTWHKQVDAYIALSSFQKKVLVKGGLPPTKIFVKPNFVYDPKVGKGDTQRQNFALYVGRLAPEKGIELLLQAYQKNFLNLPLKIVGNGPLFKTIKETAKQLFPKVQFLGEKNKTEVLSLMRQAKVLILPSVWYECLPLVFIEALACSLPVVAFSPNSFSEYVEKTGAGWLVTSKDQKSLAEVISRVASLTEVEMKNYREKARNAYLKEFTPEKNYQQLIAIYKEVLSYGKD